MKHDVLNRIEAHVRRHALHRPFDILVVGGTGAGKSSTINAIFGETKAAVGHGVDPMTSLVTSYALGAYLRLWDSPGAGDSRLADSEHFKAIGDELRRTFGNATETYKIVDLVLVLVDGSSRDLGSVTRLLQTAVMEAIEPGRILIAINQADVALKGKHWDTEGARPAEELREFLDEQAQTIRRRLHAAVGVDFITPVCFSARHGYGLDLLVDLIVDNLPTVRRRA